MCRRVGAPYENMDFQEPEWFRKYSWTEEEQDDFKEWLVENIMNDKKVRKDFLIVNRRPPKKVVQEAASWFLFNHGWKLK